MAKKWHEQTQCKHNDRTGDEDSNDERLSWCFGIIGDVQYVDADNAMNFQQTHVRRYRQSLSIFREAVQKWNSVGSDMKCAVSLGDQLDGKCNDKSKDNDDVDTRTSCLADLQQIASISKQPIFYCFGNHDYYSFNRNELLRYFIPSTLKAQCSYEKLYYDWQPSGVHMLIHTYAHTYIYTYIHAYICMHTHAHTYTYKYIHTHIHTYDQVQVAGGFFFWTHMMCL